MDARAAALSALVQFQVTEATVGDTLGRIAEITHEAVRSADVVGMTMLGENGQPTTAICTDATSPEIDQAQYAEGKGPCLDAWRDNQVISISDVRAHSDQYPAFATACLERGVLSTLSLPMRAGEAALGAMNLYGHRTEAFSDEDEALARDLAAAGANVLLNVSAYRSALELSTQLSEAMRSRAVIEQAKGVLMAGSPGLTPDGAFEMLRSASQRENLKLHVVAQRIVDGTVGRADER